MFSISLLVTYSIFRVGTELCVIFGISKPETCRNSHGRRHRTTIKIIINQSINQDTFL